MRARSTELGFTLIEVLVVTSIVAVIALAAGTFFLAGATPAVASAARDVGAAFAEADRTALAFDAATVVFAPAGAAGYSARIYARRPGDPGFAPRNGPAYESTATIGETAAPLGAPGFAFAVDSRGAVTGYANFRPGAPNVTPVPCPAAGAFVLRLSYATQVQTVTVPCTLAPSEAAAANVATPAPAWTPEPAPSVTCPAAGGCALAVLGPPPSPPAAPDPPDTGDGTPPATAQGATPAAGTTPAADPTATSDPPAAGCSAGAPDVLGFAACLADDPVQATGPAITRNSCGTHVPVADPGPAFAVTVDVFRDGALWATYAVALTTLKAPWLDIQDLPPAQTCGLLYTLAFRIAGVTPESGNAQVSPAVDTGDPAFDRQGVDALVAPIFPFGSDA